MREKKGGNILTEVFAGETRLKLSLSLKNPCTKKGKRQTSNIVEYGKRYTNR